MYMDPTVVALVIVEDNAQQNAVPVEKQVFLVRRNAILDQGLAKIWVIRVSGFRDVSIEINNEVSL